MDLSLLNLDVRPQPSWQALDLGVKLGVQHYFNMLFVWCAIATPLFLVSGVAFIERPDIWVLLVWWCKPIMEHGMLVYLSRKIFQRPTTYKDIVQSLLSRKSGLLGSLTYRRFSLRRSALMPVAVLEQQSLKKSVKRRQQLARTLESPAWWLTFVVMHVEMFLIFGTIALAFMLIPEHYANNAWELITDSSDNSLIVFNSIWIIAIAVMAPIYTSSGFCLYLNARSAIEGWDLELHFRQISLAMKQATSTVLACFIVLLCLMPTPHATAMSPVEAHQTLTTLKNKAPLGEEYTYKYLLSQEQETEKKEQTDAPKWANKLAQALEILGWALVAALTVFFMRFIWLHRASIRAWLIRRPPKNSAHTTSWSAISVHTNSRDRLKNARLLLKDGSKRGAMSELVIATLGAISTKGIKVWISSTSQSICMELMNQHQPWAIFTKQILTQWVNLAWGHYDDTSIETIQEWIEQWEQHFHHHNGEAS